jgi:hypothetical protein
MTAVKLRVERHMNQDKNDLLSRKLWIALGALSGVIGAELAGTPLSPETLDFARWVVGVYVVGQGGVDAVKAFNKGRAAVEARQIIYQDTPTPS